jgi:hypothetical protein
VDVHRVGDRKRRVVQPAGEVVLDREVGVGIVAPAGVDFQLQRVPPGDEWDLSAGAGRNRPAVAADRDSLVVGRDTAAVDDQPVLPFRNVPPKVGTAPGSPSSFANDSTAVSSVVSPSSDGASGAAMISETAATIESTARARRPRRTDRRAPRGVADR